MFWFTVSTVQRYSVNWTFIYSQYICALLMSMYLSSDSKASNITAFLFNPFIPATA
jgi:hypothetical protein